MEQLKFDFNNLFSLNVGPEHGVSEIELAQMSAQISQAHQHLQKIISDGRLRVNLGLEWAKLPFQDHDCLKEIQRLGTQIAKKYENVLFLGIGGSYLGLKAAQDALKPPYYNDFVKPGPKIYFEGNNLDPDTLRVLLKKLNSKKTCVVVISKSGETTETKAAFMVAQAWLKKTVGKKYGRQIIAITDPDSGSLRQYVRQKHLSAHPGYQPQSGLCGRPRHGVHHARRVISIAHLYSSQRLRHRRNILFLRRSQTPQIAPVQPSKQTRSALVLPH